MSKKKHTKPPTGRVPKPFITHSADRRNIVGIPAVQNPKFKKSHYKPTAH